MTNYNNGLTEEQIKHIESMKKQIAKSGDAALHEMMKIVESKKDESIQIGFYVYDLRFYRLTEGAPFFWLLSDNNSHVIDLLNERFIGDTWVARHELEITSRELDNNFEAFIIENQEIKRLASSKLEEILNEKEDYVRNNLL